MPRLRQLAAIGISVLLLLIFGLQARSYFPSLCATQAQSDSPLDATTQRNSVNKEQTLFDADEEEKLGTSVSPIAKVTMFYGKMPQHYERSLELHRAYCRNHGYRLFMLKQKTLGRLWSKTAYLLSVIEQDLQRVKEDRLQWLVWFDADIVLMNPKIPLEIFLPPAEGFDHIDYLVTADHHGLNDGCFFVRVNDRTLQFFADALALPTYKPDLELKYSEQSAAAYLFNETEKYRNRTIFVPQRWFNAYRGERDDEQNLLDTSNIPPNIIRPGDIHLHFAGTKPGNKTSMPPWVDRAEQHLPTWEMNVQETLYQEEISSFWKKEKEKLAVSRSEASMSHSSSQ